MIARRFGLVKERRRGMSLLVVLMTMTVLAILSYNLVHQAFADYYQGVMVRDTIVLQHLTDSALGKTIYYLNRDDRRPIKTPLREVTGVARVVELSGEGDILSLRITAHVPNETMPRMSSKTAYHLARNPQGRWRVVATEDEPVLPGRGE